MDQLILFRDLPSHIQENIITAFAIPMNEQAMLSVTMEGTDFKTALNELWRYKPVIFYTPDCGGFTSLNISGLPNYIDWPELINSPKMTRKNEWGNPKLEATVWIRELLDHASESFIDALIPDDDEIWAPDRFIETIEEKLQRLVSLSPMGKYVTENNKIKQKALEYIRRIRR